MIIEPERYIQQFASAGADILTVHWEACTHVHRTLQQIQEAGCQPGLALNPGTPAAMITEVVSVLDLVLVMSVNPGFGSQTFIESVLPKLADVRAILDGVGSDALIEIDGGVKPDNARLVWESGADVLVAGSAIYRPDVSVSEAVERFRSVFAT